MLKYQKKGLCKALSMLLAAVMLMTAPIGTTQAYALEGEQPTVTDVQNELPLGVSEGTATDEMLDSSTPLEEPSPQADSDAPEATPSDAEEIGLEHNPATPSDANEIQNRGMLYGLSAEIGVRTAVELEDAINKLVDGDTIKLTANIDYNKGIIIDGITMTFDVGQYKLNITNSDTSGTGCGLEVKNGGTVMLLYTTGELNASGHYYGVRANGSSTATLTNATTTGENGYGAFAVDNSEIAVLGDAEAVKNGSDGVVAWQSSNITVRGNATGNSLAAKTESYSTIHIEGDATTTGTDPGDVGVFASSNGKITVDGVISVVKPENYVRVNGANFKIDQKILPTTQSGYHTYMHPSYTGAEDSVVWVKQADAPSTVIEVSTPEELEAALGGVTDDGIIKLIANIDYNKGVVMNGKTVNFDVGAYTLNVTNGAGPGLKVEAGGEVRLTGSGKFNAIGTTYGVQADGAGAKAMVTEASGTASGGIGARANNGADITVNGNVWGQSVGAFSGEGGNIIVNGEVKGSIGAEASGEAGCIVITGNVKGTYTYGVKAGYGGKITVHGKVTSDYQDGVYAVQGGEIKVHGDVEGKNGAYVGGDAVGKYGSIHITGSVTGLNGYGVMAIYGGSAIIDGDVTGWKGSGASCSHGNIYVCGNVKGTPSGVSAYIKNSTITVKGNVMASLSYGYAVGAEISGVGGMVATGEISGKITIDGEIKSGKDYISINGVIKDGTPRSRDAVSELDGYYSYSEVNPIPTEPSGSVYATSVVFVKAGDMECEIDGRPYATLSEAIAAAKSGEITTITLLQSITHHEPVVINGKSITFVLGDFDLTIDTSTISNSTGLWVLGDGNVSCTGSGKLNVVGSDYGVRASGSELHISGNVTARQYAVMAGSAPGTGTPKVIVDGDVTVTGQDVNASSEVEAVSVGGYANVTIGGNVTANRTDEMQSVTAVYSNASTIVVGKNVTTQGSGVNAQNGGKVTIGGALHYNPTGSGDQAYIKVGYPVVSKTADDFEPTSIKPEYKEYKNGDNVVWVKEAPAVCTIGAQKFTSLNAAIASVPAGGTATITLLQSITHTKHIRVEKKTINLDLGDYNLLLDTSADGSYSPALMVIDGGKLNLIDSGTGEFNIKSHMTAISAGGMNTKATVHNVVAGDSTGVNMVGSGDYLDSNSTVTVLGSITVGNGNGVEVNAKNGKVVVGGNITAGRIGVYVWSNPGTQVTVNGDITVDGFAAMAGIRAYGDTNVDVTGNVTVRGTDCVGVHASGSEVKVDGNVASSGTGVHCDTNGKVEITGSLTAGTPFITFGTVDMTADEGIEMDEGYILYSYAYNNVRIGSIGVPVPTYTIAIQNDGNGTASANVNSAAQGEEITLTASANGGYRFKEWQVISGGVTVFGNKFTMPSGNVTIKAIFETTSAPAYIVTVQNDGNGTGSASTTSAEAGTEVTLTASPNSGFVLKEWQVISGGVTVSGNKFTMPAGNVTVKAIFEVASAPTYLVTINDGGSGATGAGNYEAGTTVNIYAGTRSNYTFTGWTSSDVAITNASNKNASFTMHGKSVTVIANWTYNGDSSGGGSGGSSDSGSSTVITTTPGKTPDQPVTAAASVTATAGANGAASAAIPEKSVTDAIAKAQAYARAQGKAANGIAVELNVTMPKGATSLTATLTRSSLNSLVSAGVSSLTINGSPVTVSFDQKALAEIQKQISGDVTITIKPAQNLSAAAKRLIGTRPVYGITVSYVKAGKATVVSAFNGGIATISIPYKPDKDEATGYLYGVYADEKGNATRIEDSAYDANAGAILIPTGHLSVYGVGYTAPSAKFTDTRTHWGKESIDYVVGRELLGGTSETTFAPDTAMTRGMLVTALGRLAGVDVKAYTGSSFTDVKADSTFRPYIEWAYKKGVVQGIGNSQFAPDRAITREEIAVIFANYAKATGYKLPVTRETTTYADASSIGSAYKTAVTSMQQAGIMMGGTDNKFNPKASATRAEVSSMLHRYVKLTINPTTAQGWALNDAGQYLYYKDGKALTGTQTIDGARYFFNTDGTLKTGWVKDGDNWRYYSGNKDTVGWLDINDKQYYFTKDGLMVSGKWLQIDSKWYYFYTDGSLAKDTKVDGYEVGPDGVRKTK